MNTGLSCTPRLPKERMRAARRHAIFDCCKWDPQVGDTPALADFAVVLERGQWAELRELAMALYAETLAAERAVLRDARLLDLLALPRELRRALAGGDADAQRTCRVMRFDFHPTTAGWRVTEVNSDVPGGYIEAGGFSERMCREFAESGLAPGLSVSGNPAQTLARRLREKIPAGASIALAHATAYADDRQVMVYLQQELARAGLRAALASPADVQWRDGAAWLADGQRSEKIDALFRFFPAEWLPALRGKMWHNFFAPKENSGTLTLNPGAAIISQTKRFPLLWPRLPDNTLKVWPRLMPKTRPLAGAERNWLMRKLSPIKFPDEREWVLKPALGRVGEDVLIASVTPARDAAKIRRRCSREPSQWVAQRRFDSAPVLTPDGRRHLCAGVFVIDGVVGGIYGRMAAKPLINSAAREVPVLVRGK